MGDYPSSYRVLFSCEDKNIMTIAWNPKFSMSEKVRELHTPMIKNGLLYNHDGSLYTGTGKYVLTASQELVIKRINYYHEGSADREVFLDYNQEEILPGFVNHNEYKDSDVSTGDKVFYHTNLVYPYKVTLAGWLRAEKGKVVCIDRRSGHYQPQEKDFKYGLKVLKKKLHLNLSDAERLNVGKSCNGYRIDYAESPDWYVNSFDHTKWDCRKGSINKDFPLSIIKKKV